MIFGVAVAMSQMRTIAPVTDANESRSRSLPSTLKCILPKRTAGCGEILHTWHHTLRRFFLPTHVFSPITYHHRTEGIKSDLQVQNCEDRCVVALKVVAIAAFHRRANFWPSCFVLTYRPEQAAQHLEIPLGDQDYVRLSTAGSLSE